MEIDLNSFLFLLEDLSGVVSCLPVKMQEPVTVGTQVTTGVAQNDGQCLPIVMVVTGGSLLATSPTPVSTAQTLHMILVQDTQGRHRQPDAAAPDPLLRRAVVSAQLGQVKDSLGHGALGNVGPVL